MSRLDLGVGQRLALGFGLLLACLLAFAGAVLVWTARSAAVERDFAQGVAVRVGAAQDLERSVLRTAISYRTYLLERDASALSRLRGHLGAAASALGRLRALTHDEDVRPLFQAADSATVPYLEAVRTAAEAAESGRAPAPLGEMSALRDASLAAVAAYTAAKVAKGDRALAVMVANRERIWRSTVLVLAIVTSIALLVAWLTTRAVRRPTAAVLAATNALGAGDWSPAIALRETLGRHAARDELRRIAHAVGLAAGQLRDRERALADALAELGDRNQQIQAYNEELQAQNEELQAQYEEIQAQSEELQAQSEEIAAQNQELRDQGEQLRDADRHKTQFLAVLAHELRNPMAPISSSVALLRRVAPGSDAGQRALSVIERQSRHLVRLIDDLLDVARISQAKVRLNVVPVDLGAVARECADDFMEEFAAKDVILALELPAEPLWVDGDRARLAQVTGNLLVNALKFTDRGGRVTVTVASEPGLGDVLLTVDDTGIGLEAALLERLFEPFMQGATGLARTNSGLGLGLALVKGLVALHEGSVSAHSAGPGHGARFSVRLPRRAAPDGAAVQPERPAAPSPARVLLVEDNVDAAEALRSVLALDGHEVWLAHSGPHGVERARELQPDVVICDIGLPGVDGYELARTVRADGATNAPLLVAVTGYATPTDRAAARAAGFDLHFAKPLDTAQLQEIYAALRVRQSGEVEERSRSA